MKACAGEWRGIEAGGSSPELGHQPATIASSKLRYNTTIMMHNCSNITETSILSHYFTPNLRILQTQRLLDRLTSLRRTGGVLTGNQLPILPTHTNLHPPLLRRLMVRCASILQLRLQRKRHQIHQFHPLFLIIRKRRHITAFNQIFPILRLDIHQRRGSVADSAHNLTLIRELPEELDAGLVGSKIEHRPVTANGEDGVVLIDLVDDGGERHGIFPEVGGVLEEVLGELVVLGEVDGGGVERGFAAGG